MLDCTSVLYQVRLQFHHSLASSTPLTHEPVHQVKLGSAFLDVLFHPSPLSRFINTPHTTIVNLFTKSS